ncbi:MFS transporter [Streptomyces sp. 3MP-14]|uniref:MFS transporter n=1 Tax=Streptomyces mimosae TaxID=2586635 RepID=A0A5N6A2G6_9ACTN|nr:MULTISPECIES: MDR family MFS transporter [Streptomyces]KAB8162293.1 MFS transporter [Streptomyces mimosae]KAB8174000.1 MFS transporter [Streptomyces sp. 3MP-14]
MDHGRVLRAMSGLLIVLFMAMISSTIVSVALPQIIGSLNGTQSQYTWVVTATLLTSTASTPVWGKLADLFSKKLLLTIGILIFTFSSLACGFAQSAGQLIGFRAVQGLGLGALQVLVQVIIAAMVSPKERGRYNGYLGGVMAVATVGGPLLGGAITDVSWLGWRWCFFVGVPFTLLALVLLSRTLKLVEVPRPDARVDYLGASLIAVSVSLLLLWVTFVDAEFGWVSWQTGAMVGAALVLGVAAVVVENRVREPIVPLHVVRRRDPALAIVASLAVGMAMFGGAVFLGQYFQVGRGYSPTEAGLLTIPMMAGVLLSAAVSGRLVSRTGKVKPFIVAGVIALTLGFLTLSTIDHETSLTLVGAGMFLVGVGVGMSMQNLLLVVQNTVPLTEVGAASGAVTFFRSLGGTMGVSILGAVLANQVSTKISQGLTAAGIDTSGGGDGSTLNVAAMPPAVQEIVRAAYGDATGHIFLISAAIAVVGVVATLFLTPTRLRDSMDLAPAAEGGGASEAALEEPTPAVAKP